MKKIILAIIFAMSATAAFAACTEADLQSKGTEIGTKLEQIITKDPSSVAKWQQRFTELAQSEAAKTTDLEKSCAMADDLIKELDAALQ